MGVRGAYRVAAAALLLVPASGALASSGGITGVSQAPGCASCHGGGAFAYTANIVGAPTTVAPSSLNNAFSLTYSGTGASAGGFNLAVESLAGTLGTGDAEVQIVGDEATHNGKTIGSSFTWSFNWDAPATVGVYTFFYCANPVNNDLGTTGDGPIDCASEDVTVNTAPNAVNDASSVSEDSVSTCISVLSNDTSGASSNETGDSISLFSLGTPSQGGSVAIGGGSCTTSQARYTPAANFNGTETFTYTIRDSFSSVTFQDSATVTMTVNAVNDAPSLNLSINNIATYTENGAAVTVDGVVTITDIDSVNLNQATVSITGNFQSAEDELICPNPVIIGISCSYSSGTGVLTLSGTATLANYELALEDVGYLNSSDDPSTATRTISVQIRDSSNALSVADTTTLNVTAANDAPVAVNDSATVDEDSTLNVLSVLSNDTDVDSGDTKTITLVNAAAVSTCPTMTATTNGAVCKSNALPNNTLSYTPNAAFVGSDTFTYTMQDSAAVTSSATVSITIANVGDAPVAIDDAATISEDSSNNTFDVLANDTDVDVGDSKTITQVNGGAVATCPSTTATAQGTVCRSSASPNNTLSYTPATDFAGSDSFTYTVQDSATLTDVGTVSVTITNVNDTPVAVADAQAVAEDAAPVGLDVLANDTDGDQTGGPGDTKRIISVGATSNGGSVTIVGAGIDNTLSYDSAPNFFGTETFSYTMEDSTGLTASATVTMTVTAVNDAPLITSSAITTAQDGVPYSYQVTVSDPDDANNGTDLAFSLPTFPAGMSVSSTGLIQWTPPVNVAAGYNVTVQVADGGENGAAAASQSFTINVSVPDTDNDGMPDSFENQYGFDPDDPSDAAGDADGDGLSNLEEYQQGSNPTLDDVGPLVTSPADLVVPATGFVTVVDLGTASAVDGKDGVLTPTSDWTFPVVRPGRYTVTWTASDLAGNVGTDTQQVDVLPLANLNVDQVSGEGVSVNVTVTLNGAPPQYPVTIPYTVGGSAAAGDSDAATGSFTIASGTSATVPVALAPDGSGEPAETVIFTMTGATQAALGTRRTHTITITDANAAPAVSLSAAQGAFPRLVAYQGDGLMTISATASDPNGDVLSFDWSDSADLLGIDGETTSDATFDPSGLAAGVYPVRLTVADATTQAGAELLVTVAAGTSTEVDIDADGIPDSVDAIVTDGALLEDQAGDPSAAELLETDPGLSLRRGRTSLAAGRTGALIAMSDIVAFGVGDGGLPLGADSFDNLGGIFDFEIHGVAAGGTARVVLPLQTAIRDGAAYRKFDPVTGWHAFVADANNAVASANSAFGQCPGPASAEYVTGLQPFADCVRLTLQDGGPNDTDGAADGVIRDPGGVAITVNTPGATVTVSSGAWLAFGLPLALLLRLRRRVGLAALALVALLVAAPVRAEHHIRIHYSGDLATGFDDNVTNAQHGADIRESGFASGGANVDYFRALNLYTTLVLRGSLQGEYWNSFDGLTNGKATGMARVLYRANGNFYTPTLAAWVSASAWEFDSAIRDSNEYRSGVFATEQLTTQITGRLALTANRREADGRVFDLSGWSTSLNVDWVPAPRSTVYIGYQYYDGDVASTATPSLWIGLAARGVVEPDDAFGGIAGGLRAYRLDATAQIATLGYNYALTRKLSADLQGQYITTTADYGNEYERTVAVISLLARF